MTIETISLISILGALALIVVLAFKDLPLLVIGPLCSAILLLFSGMDVLSGMTGAYSEAFADFARSNFLMFLLACLFGSLISHSGAAHDIAYKMLGLIDKLKGNQKFVTIMVLAAIAAVLTFGGIGGYVIVFTMVPFSRILFKKMDIPWHLFIGSLALGGNLFTAIMIPGSPAIQNLMPIEYLGTDAKAAPRMALCCAALSILIASIYLWFCLKKAEKAGEGYLPTGAVIDQSSGDDTEENREVSNLAFLRALAAPAILIIALNVFNFPAVMSLAIGCAACILIYFKNYENIWKTISDGATKGTLTLASIGAVVGFSGVVTAVPGYNIVVNAIENIPGPPLVQLALATNLMAGIAGSASGGLGIALNAFGQKFLDMGIDPQVIHRISAISSFGLDSMPFGGGTVNRLKASGLTHKQAYKHEFWISAVLPFFISFFAVFLAQIGIV